MCGITGIFNLKKDMDYYRSIALDMSSKVKHRGPDWSGIYADKNAVLAHQRLAIVDPEHGSQPLIDIKTGNVLSVNGEIYNHLNLHKELKKKHDFQTDSDCEVILYLYDEYGPEFVSKLSGIFAFVIYDKQKNDFYIARDHLGICPVYWGKDQNGTIYVSSEMKALDRYCTNIEEFPAGSYYLHSLGKVVRWYNPNWIEEIPTKDLSLDKLREELESSVKKQLMADVPYGVLISGGLDSSIIAAITSKYHNKDLGRLHSFAVGLKDSNDLKYAKDVAAYLGTKHHEVIFTIEEAMDALKEVIYHIETFDVTTIRASTPMYLMARKIKSLGIKMVLSGEGSDEIFGGYLYFHMAPNPEELHKESVRKLLMLSKYDCLRANKSTAAWGVEARVPFLDKEFLDFAMNIDPKYKMCPGTKIEKEILRKAFEGYIPNHILWRQKEQFSDGVGYSWIDHLKKYTSEVVSDKMLSEAKLRFPLQTPQTKEEYYYRMIFDSLFPNTSAALTVPVGPSIACSTPTAIKWSKEFEQKADPSGRSISLHKG